jgi:hypothetical protein
MQRKPRQVVSLELDDIPDESDEPQSSPKNATDVAYQLALHYLERGMTEKKIADQLVLQGISRPVAAELARKVWKENPATRNQNVTILIGAGAFFIVTGMLFLLPRILNNEGLPAFSPAYLMMFFGVYLAVQGYINRREIR